jgi:hypothetical protein
MKECPGMTGFSGAGGTPPVWAYGTQQPEGRLEMPSGVGVVLKAHQPLIVNMHYVNPGTEALKVQVKVNVETFAKGETYIPAAAFVTYNTAINIPPNGTQTVQGDCDVPTGAKFFALTTHSHKYTTKAAVNDADKVVLTTEDWGHPTQSAFATPFLQFASGKLSYHCDYMNTSSETVTTGESAVKNEMCMAIGYYFPATETKLCVNSAVLQH